ncbi:ComEA family DNA-binding protein [Vreelandella jeotgali]|uniref:ComEA family DNA-binding protein n=1 Tax=Vreelandella jeotgali TaxID=553386 RepID=UPI000349D9A5
MTLKTLAAALLFTLSLGLSTGVTAQQVAPINVNTADAELLAELPGIGPSRAEALIEEREANGTFEDADELTRISGIGEVTVGKIRDEIEF